MTRSPHRPGSAAFRGAGAVVVALGVVTAAALAGCGGSGTTPTGVIVVPSGSAGASGAASASPSAVPSDLPSPSLRVGPYGLVIDPSLLRVLPATVAGLPVTESGDLEAAALGDLDIPTNVSAYAAAVVGSLGDPDWATVSILALRPSAGQSFVAAWEQQYDEAACSRASGIAGRGETTIGGWLTQTATCAGGVLAYHVQIVDRGILVSISSVGPRKLGEQVVAALGP